MPKKDYSLPTTEELSNLRETSELFKSNLFKLQVRVWGRRVCAGAPRPR